MSAFASFDDGSGNALYAAGRGFFAPNSSPFSGYGLARWNGVTWAPIAPTQGGEFSDVEVFNGELFLGNSASGWISKFDGINYTNFAMSNGQIFTLETFDDGSGEKLCVGGTFTSIAGQSISRLACWNGNQWTGTSANFQSQDSVWCLTSSYDEIEPALYIGGNFEISASDGVASNIARWNGSTWNTLGLPPVGSVRSIEAIQEGPFRTVYASGSGLNEFLKWDGQTWSSLPAVDGSVMVLKGFEDGQGLGKTLFLGGNFSHVGGQPSASLARWYRPLPPCSP